MGLDAPKPLSTRDNDLVLMAMGGKPRERMSMTSGMPPSTSGLKTL